MCSNPFIGKRGLNSYNGANTSRLPEFKLNPQAKILADKEIAERFIKSAREVVGKTNSYEARDLFTPHDMIYVADRLGMKAVFALQVGGLGNHWTVFLGLDGDKKIVYHLQPDQGEQIIAASPEDRGLVLYPTSAFLQEHGISTEKFIFDKPDGKKGIRLQELKDLVVPCFNGIPEIPGLSSYRQTPGTTDCGPLALYLASLFSWNSRCSFDSPTSNRGREGFLAYLG